MPAPAPPPSGIHRSAANSTPWLEMVMRCGSVTPPPPSPLQETPAGCPPEVLLHIICMDCCADRVSTPAGQGDVIVAAAASEASSSRLIPQPASILAAALNPSRDAVGVPRGVERCRQ